jgi:hypothetical protein
MVLAIKRSAASEFVRVDDEISEQFLHGDVSGGFLKAYAHPSQNPGRMGHPEKIKASDRRITTPEGKRRRTVELRLLRALDEFHGGGVHAVAQAGGLGAVIKNVAQVGLAFGAGDFVANHAQAGIG